MGDDEAHADHATASETSSQRTELNLNLVVQISLTFVRFYGINVNHFGYRYLIYL